MTDQESVDEPGPEPDPPAGRSVPALPSMAEMVREIDQDRRHERYLVRAAVVAAVVIALAVAVRLVWG